MGISIGFAVTAAFLALPFAAIRLTGNGYMMAETWSGLALTLRLASQPHLEEGVWDQSRRAFVMQDISAAYVSAHIQGLVLPVQWGFIVAAVLIVAGLSAEILAGRWRARMQTVAGFGAAAALTIGELVVRRSVHAPRFDNIEPVPTYGFWLALGLLVALGLAGLFTLLLRRSDKGVLERLDHDVAHVV
jgi:hypothetical protein